MRKKLELKDIAPYLPYGLMCKWNKSKPYKLAGLKIGNESVKNELWIWKDDDDYFTGYLYECKPILRPLSDLINNEDIRIKFDTNLDEFDTQNLREALVYNRFYSKNIWETFKVMEELFKNHLDVFGLIEQGLAIDINTLKP